MTTAVPRETIPYPGKPYLATHPDRLATIARLFGLTTPDVASCRMLEVGCGDSSNLIAMAAAFPGAEFVGVDLSESAIGHGRALARQTGLKNVTLIEMNLCDIGESQGEFDYIAAHGIYSWVPARVRDRLIQVCAQRLRPDGVAMVSYAAHPGGFVEQLVRAPMLFHARRFGGGKDKVGAARMFAEMMLKHAPAGAMRALYQEEWDRIAGNPDGFLLHDQLVEDYTPVYFAEFVRHAATHGLQYLGEANLGEADLCARGTVGVDPAAADEVREFAAGDRIATEQYLDFLRCRRFRQTILCHSDRAVLREPDASALDGCFAAAPPYLCPNGAGLPALETAWPGFVPCEDLHALEALLRLFAAGRIDVRTVPPLLDGGDSARPRATALTRAQAASDQPVTNLLHHEVNIDDQFTRTFLTMLDGRRTRRELVEKAGDQVERTLTMLGNHALLRR